MRVAAPLGMLLTMAVAGRCAKPNIVFILTDDQDMRLGSDDKAYTAWGSVDAMPTVQKRFLQEGGAMQNFFVATPICCPSRTEFFTGRYFHNVRGKDGAGCMHANTTGVGEKEGLFAEFTQAGYEVGVFGKVTNDQGPQLDRIARNRAATWIDSPLDYNDYNGLQYYRYDSATGQNTSIEKLNVTHPRFGSVYQTSQLSNRTALWLDALAARPVPPPFFMYVGPHAPHWPAIPAPWHEDAFPDGAVPRTPNYNCGNEGKVRHIQQNPPMIEALKCWQDQQFRDRWRTLLSVDDLVGVVYDKLVEHGFADSTYMVYSSDHGYKLGQWRLATLKQHPYDTDIRSPLFVRGPGVVAGSLHPAVTGNVDIVPTLLDLAGIVPAAPAVRDGRSFAATLLGKEEGEQAERAGGVKKRESFLSEYESVATLYSDRSPVWTKNGEVICGEKCPNSPSGSIPDKECKPAETWGGGNCYMCDSLETNNFRVLRTINATHDTKYIEWGGPKHFAEKWSIPPIHFEFYNLTSDPYEVTNLYAQLPAGLQHTLHSNIGAYYACSGADCP